MYKINGITITVVLVLISKSMCRNQDPLNVGTVLFSLADQVKSQWDENNIGLLQARRYAQGLIPPTHTSEVFDEDYIKTLLKYFKEIYKSIKIESTDHQINDIMTTAASDTLGGYLKMWVLPITKFAFYSGTVSKENALRIFNFYEDVKKYLSTDGSNWRQPDLKVLRSVAINIAPPPKFSYTLSLKYPCDNLVYFEKADNGLMIPMPTITWDDKTSTMFLPLKNQSLIFLNSPKSTNTLFKYYDIAKNCLNTAKGSDEEEFNKRFQLWVINNVLPHLNDDNLYFGLDSVLCLINATKDFSEKITTLFDKTKENPPLTSYFPFNITSKKLILVTVILLLEICWCILAMIYMKCTKSKTKKRRKDSFIGMCISYNEKSVNAKSIFDDNKSQSKPYTDDFGVKLYQKPRRRQGEHGIEEDAAQENVTRSSKSVYPGIDDEARINSSSSKLQSTVDHSLGPSKMSPYCYDCTSNPSMFTIPSSTLQAKSSGPTNNLSATATVTIFKNNELSKICPTVIQKDIKMHHSNISKTKKKPKNQQNVNIKEIPIMFKGPAKHSSFNPPKKSKKRNTIGKKENSKTERCEDANTNSKLYVSRDSKRNELERGLPKHKKITLSHKGAKSNSEKPYLELKITRPETENVEMEDDNRNRKPELRLCQINCKIISESSIEGTSKGRKDEQNSKYDDKNTIQIPKNETKVSFLETVKSNEDSKVNTTI